MLRALGRAIIYNAFFNYNINRTPAHIDLNAVLNLIYMRHALHIRRVRRDNF